MSKYTEEEEHPPVASKKNTKKWCGGHKNREHTYKWQQTKFSLGGYSELVCQKCGKIAELCFRWRNKTERDDPNFKCKCGLSHERKPFPS